jgi:hypothetical protein
MMPNRTLLRLTACLLLLSVVLGGCGTTSEPLPALDLNPYTITFETDPAAPVTGAPVLLKTGVSGKEPLSKRAEISFEIKKSGSEERVEVEAERKEEGRYESRYTFKEAGKYSITVHVITRSIHQVSNKELEVK